MMKKLTTQQKRLYICGLFIIHCGLTLPMKAQVSSKTSSDIKIGMIQTGDYTKGYNRLIALGYTIILLNATDGLTQFENYDIVYLPMQWASTTQGNFSQIEEKSTDYQTYVNNGGGLFLEQPNPSGHPGDSVTTQVLPYPITFHNGFTGDDFPPIIVNLTHEITQGLNPEDLPFPCDQMTSVNSNYEVLVQGKTTLSPSLVVGFYGNGRILVHTANPWESAGHPFSDTTYVRMIEWTGKETTPVAENQPKITDHYHLFQNYPNPFNSITTIKFSIPILGFSSLEVYNTKGTLVTILVSENLSPGEYNIRWNARELPSGIYISKLKTNTTIKTKKLILLK